MFLFYELTLNEIIPHCTLINYLLYYTTKYVVTIFILYICLKCFFTVMFHYKFLMILIFCFHYNIGIFNKQLILNRNTLVILPTYIVFTNIYTYSRYLDFNQQVIVSIDLNYNESRNTMHYYLNYVRPWTLVKQGNNFVSFRIISFHYLISVILINN